MGPLKSWDGTPNSVASKLEVKLELNLKLSNPVVFVSSILPYHMCFPTPVTIRADWWFLRTISDSVCLGVCVCDTSTTSLQEGGGRDNSI